MANPSVEKGDKRIGKRVKALREERGMSQKKLAEAVSVSQSCITRLESGQSMVSVFVICDIARALGVSTSVILDEPPVDFDVSQLSEFVKLAENCSEDERKTLMRYLEINLEFIRRGMKGNDWDHEE